MSTTPPSYINLSLSDAQKAKGFCEGTYTYDSDNFTGGDAWQSTSNPDCYLIRSQASYTTNFWYDYEGQEYTYNLVKIIKGQALVDKMATMWSEHLNLLATDPYYPIVGGGISNNPFYPGLLAWTKVPKSFSIQWLGGEDLTCAGCADGIAIQTPIFSHTGLVKYTWGRHQNPLSPTWFEGGRIISNFTDWYCTGTCSYEATKYSCTTDDRYPITQFIGDWDSSPDSNSECDLKSSESPGWYRPGIFNPWRQYISEDDYGLYGFHDMWTLTMHINMGGGSATPNWESFDSDKHFWRGPIFPPEGAWPNAGTGDHYVYGNQWTDSGILGDWIVRDNDHRNRPMYYRMYTFPSPDKEWCPLPHIFFPKETKLFTELYAQAASENTPSNLWAPTTDTTLYAPFLEDYYIFAENTEVGDPFADPGYTVNTTTVPGTVTEVGPPITSCPELVVNGDPAMVIACNSQWVDPEQNATPNVAQEDVDTSICPSQIEITYSKYNPDYDCTSYDTRLLSIIDAADIGDAELTLIGDSVITLCQGDSWIDPGVIAKDKDGNDITPEITAVHTDMAWLQGQVTPGTYLRTYTIGLGANNYYEMTVERRITVESCIPTPVEGPVNLTAEEDGSVSTNPPVYGPINLNGEEDGSVSTNPPLLGPDQLTAVESLVNPPSLGPVNSTAEIVAPLSGPAYLSGEETSGGGGGGGVPTTPPAEGPLNLTGETTSVYRPAEGPLNLTGETTSVYRPVQGPSNLVSEEICTELPISVNGYCPLYTTESCANQNGDGTSHTHEFDGVTYYMPNGTYNYHGDCQGPIEGPVSLGASTLGNPVQGPLNLRAEELNPSQPLAPKYKGFVFDPRTSSVSGPFVSESITAVTTKDNSSEMYAVNENNEILRTVVTDLNNTNFSKVSDPFADLETPIQYNGVVMSKSGKGYLYRNLYKSAPFAEAVAGSGEVVDPLYFKDGYLSIAETNWLHLGDEHNEKQIHRVDLRFHKNSVGHLFLYVQNDDGMVKGQYKGALKEHMKVFTNLRGRGFQICMMIVAHKDYPWAMREMAIGHLYGKSF